MNKFNALRFVGVIISIAATQPALGYNDEFKRDPRILSGKSLASHDFRLAGWGQGEGFRPLGSPPARVRLEPYGLICLNLPDSAYKYIYYKGDAIGPNEMSGFKSVKNFMLVYNRRIFLSGKVRTDWGCKLDTAIGRQSADPRSKARR